MSELSREDVFQRYEEEVHKVASEIVEDLEEKSEYSALDGREWCEENNVPENSFADAVNCFLGGVDWGVSPMYPFRNDEEVKVRPLELEEEEDDVEEQVEKEAEELVEEMEELDEDE